MLSHIWRTVSALVRKHSVPLIRPEPGLSSICKANSALIPVWQKGKLSLTEPALWVWVVVVVVVIVIVVVVVVVIYPKKHLQRGSIPINPFHEDFLKIINEVVQLEEKLYWLINWLLVRLLSLALMLVILCCQFRLLFVLRDRDFFGQRGELKMIIFTAALVC